MSRVTTIPASLPTTATASDYLAQEELIKRATALTRTGDNLLITLTMARTDGAREVYGQGLPAASALLATQPKGGAMLVLADILARKLAEVYAPDSAAAASPVPAGVALSVGGVVIEQFMSDLDALISNYTANADGVVVVAQPQTEAP